MPPSRPMLRLSHAGRNRTVQRTLKAVQHLGSHLANMCREPRARSFSAEPRRCCGREPTETSGRTLGQRGRVLAALAAMEADVVQPPLSRLALALRDRAST